MIQSTASEVVAAYLIGLGTLGIGRSADDPTWPISKGALPTGTVSTTARPVGGDSWVSCRDVTPYTEGKYQSTGESVVKPKVQILVRHKDYDAASLQARKIAEALSPVNRATVETLSEEEVLFEACCIEQQPAFLYEEEKNRRQVFVLVVKVTISEV